MTMQIREPVMEMAYFGDLDPNPDFDNMVRLYGLNPGLDVVLYEDAGGEVLDALDRTPAEPWFPPVDLESFARHLALNMGTTYTTYTRENADALRWMLENDVRQEPSIIDRWRAELVRQPAEIAAEPFVDAAVLSVTIHPTGALPLFQEPASTSLLGLLDGGDDVAVEEDV